MFAAIDLLEDIVVDPDVLHSPVHPTKFGKNTQGKYRQLVEHVNLIYWKLQELERKNLSGESPETSDFVNEADMQALINAEGSQIGNKKRHFCRILRTAILYTMLVDAAQTSYDGRLALPNLEFAHMRGLIHDLPATYTRYDDDFRQDEKDWALYLHAKHFGIDSVAEDVALHNRYWGFLELLKDEDQRFERLHLYSKWTQALKDPEGIFSYDQLQKEFVGFLESKERLGLILLSAADCIENGQESLTTDPEQLHNHYQQRMKDIVRRHYREAEKPTALGISLVEKGEHKRLKQNVKLAISLVTGSTLYEQLPAAFKAE